MLRKKMADRVPADKPVSSVTVPCQFAASYPNLAEFLFADRFDDGTAREPGTILLVVDEGRVKAWVNDKEAQETAWVSAQSLSELFAAVERGLGSGGLDWRRPKASARKRP